MAKPVDLPDDKVLRQMMRNLEHEARTFKSGRKPCNCPRGLDSSLGELLQTLEDRVNNIETGNNNPCTCPRDGTAPGDADQSPGLQALEDRVTDLEKGNKPCNCDRKRRVTGPETPQTKSRRGGSEKRRRTSDEGPGPKRRRFGSPVAQPGGDRDDDDDENDPVEEIPLQSLTVRPRERRNYFPIFELPREVRLVIWDEFFEEEPEIQARRGHAGEQLARTVLNPENYTYTGEGRPRDRGLNVLLASREMYRDTAEVFYRRRRFTFRGFDGPIPANARRYSGLLAAVPFLRDRSPVAFDYIRSLRIDLTTGQGIHLPTLDPATGIGAGRLGDLTVEMERLTDLRHLDLTFEGMPGGGYYDDRERDWVSGNHAEPLQHPSLHQFVLRPLLSFLITLSLLNANSIFSITRSHPSHCEKHGST